MSASTPSDTRHTGAFFGRRKGHPLRPHQASLMERLLPRLAIDLHGPRPDSLASLFPHGSDDVGLEIGFGGGEHLTGEATARPRMGFIGCEPFVNGMAKALAHIEAGRLENVRLHFGDAAELLAWLPTASLVRIDLLYPDPWPKRRHWKRRFVQETRVAALARILRPGGEFRFATDWPDYVEWTLERMSRSEQFTWTAERADDWRQPWPGYVATRYESKAKIASRAPCYLVFRRTE